MLFPSSFLQAQAAQKELIINCTDQETQVLKKYQFNKSPFDKEEATSIISALIAALQKDGYFTAIASELSALDHQFVTTLKIGRQYTWAKLSVGNLSPLLQEKTRFRENFI